MESRKSQFLHKKKNKRKRELPPDYAHILSSYEVLTNDIVSNYLFKKSTGSKSIKESGIKQKEFKRSNKNATIADEQATFQHAEELDSYEDVLIEFLDSLNKAESNSKSFIDALPTFTPPTKKQRTQPSASHPSNEKDPLLEFREITEPVQLRCAKKCKDLQNQILNHLDLLFVPEHLSEKELTPKTKKKFIQQLTDNEQSNGTEKEEAEQSTEEQEAKFASLDLWRQIQNVNSLLFCEADNHMLVRDQEASNQAPESNKEEAAEEEDDAADEETE